MDGPRVSSSQANQLELERVTQEQTGRVRTLKKEQQDEVQKLIDLHKRDMANLDQAFNIELTTGRHKHDQILQDTYTAQAAQMAKLDNDQKVNIAQLQENFRSQVEEVRISGDRQLTNMRELYLQAQENLKAQKGEKV